MAGVTLKFSLCKQVSKQINGDISAGENEKMVKQLSGSHYVLVLSVETSPIMPKHGDTF